MLECMTSYAIQLTIALMKRWRDEHRISVFGILFLFNPEIKGKNKGNHSGHVEKLKYLNAWYQTSFFILISLRTIHSFKFKESLFSFARKNATWTCHRCEFVFRLTQKKDTKKDQFLVCWRIIRLRYLILTPFLYRLLWERLIPLKSTVFFFLCGQECDVHHREFFLQIRK